ncbi:hypothetical protein BHE74_00041231, partial [Ensete ventricosum]
IKLRSKERNINPSASFTTHFRSMEMPPRKMYSLKSTRNYLQMLKSDQRTHPCKLLTCDVERTEVQKK